MAAPGPAHALLEAWFKREITRLDLWMGWLNGDLAAEPPLDLRRLKREDLEDLALHAWAPVHSDRLIWFLSGLPVPEADARRLRANGQLLLAWIEEIDPALIPKFTDP